MGALDAGERLDGLAGQAGQVDLLHGGAGGGEPLVDLRADTRQRLRGGLAALQRRGGDGALGGDAPDQPAEVGADPGDLLDLVRLPGLGDLRRASSPAVRPSSTRGTTRTARIFDRIPAERSMADLPRDDGDRPPAQPVQCSFGTRAPDMNRGGRPVTRTAQGRWRVAACPTVGRVRAAVVETPGGPDALVVREVPDPRPGPDEVVVAVAAAGVNRADLLQRQGRYAVPSGAPAWPGLECSGTVAALGEGVTGLAVGDPVCALLDGGGYAEQVVVRATQVLPVPAGVDLVEAAALPEAAATVHSNVVATAGLRAGETFLVHGATSGIGTFATQLVRALGGIPYATAGSPAKVAAAAGFGAEVVLDYRADDLAARLDELTGGAGVDVVLDPVGARYLDLHVRVLATGGRLVVIGLMGGRSAELDLAALMTKRATVHGSTLRARPWQEKADICGRWPARCGRSSPAAPSGRSSTGSCRWSRRARRTGSSRPASTSARCCWSRDGARWRRDGQPRPDPRRAPRPDRGAPRARRPAGPAWSSSPRRG